jgi:hypothetical protein
MAVNTYFGSGKMTAIYKGAVEITKIYHGSDLVYTSFVAPNIPQIYEDFYVSDAVSKNANNNYDTDFYVGDNIQKKV